MTRTLLLIFAFIALTLGSFIWFVVTWDRDAEQPITWGDTAPFALAQMLKSSASPADKAYAPGVYGVCTACVQPIGGFS